MMLIKMCIVQDINKKIDEILVRDVDLNTLHGRVCMLCDRLLTKQESAEVGIGTFKKHTNFFKGENLVIPQSLRDEYSYSNPFQPEITKELSGCLLSPRSKLIPGSKKNHWKVSLCKECKPYINKRKIRHDNLPRFAIANGMTIGSAPECIKVLNDVELALVSQARFRGHLFSYWGGCHKSIKGWHSFYDVDAGHTTAVLDTVSKMTSKTNIAVVLCGPMTTKQREALQRKTYVDCDKVLAAFNWLKENNILYKNLPTPEIGQPTVIDTSETVASTNSDIESKEELTVVFPSGDVTTGGCNTGADFEVALAEIRAKTKDDNPVLVSKPSQRAVRDFAESNLMKAFPAQFPYGYGSHEDLNVKVSQNGYLDHLLRLSLPAFHESCFVLTAHNMFERSRILTGSIWKVTGNKEPCNVTEEQLNEAVSRKLNGLPPQAGAGTDFLKSIRSVRKFLGHTNEAAAAAQSKFLSLTHHYGCPKVLFTVSFDDSLDLRILTLSGEPNAEDWISGLSNLDDDDLVTEMRNLESIRLKCPGLCALNFEMLLEIVLEKIIGDNDTRTGLFGKLDAYGVAIEEQGRKTLHAHILVYTNDWNDTLANLQSDRKQTRRQAEIQVKKFVDKVMSTELTSSTSSTLYDCQECDGGKLEYGDASVIRCLRHRLGCVDPEFGLLKCSNCKAVVSGDDLAKKRIFGDAENDCSDEVLKAKVARDVLAGTTFDQPSQELTGKVNYRYNHHLSCHTRTCFKKGEECRSRLPDIPEEETIVWQSEEAEELFDWSGASFPCRNVTVRPRRNIEDAYTNTYCKAISSCKAPANSNVSVTSGCRSCIYCTCYASKGTQKEDTQEMVKMCSYVGRRFKEVRKESSLFEGLSRLMGAVIVGTSEHVVSAPMASYLVRNNGSRFRFSEEFQYIPLREMVDFLMNGMKDDDLDMAVANHEDGCFLNNQVLCYIHRPTEFEDVPMLKCFENYRVQTKSKQKYQDNEDSFDIDNKKHPGYKKQKVKLRPEPVLVGQFSHWCFPDAATFGGCIWNFTKDNVPNTVETYCRSILLLNQSYRTLDDLTINGSFFQKFRQLYPCKYKLDERMQKILENVQLFYNSVRMPGVHDPLCDLAPPYQCPTTGCSSDDEIINDDDNFVEGMFSVEEDKSAQPPTPSTGNTRYSLAGLRDGGYRKCGYTDLPDENLVRHKKPTSSQSHGQSTQPVNHEFIQVEPPAEKAGTKRKRGGRTVRDVATTHKLMELVYTANKRILQQRTSQQHKEPEIIADGTVRSILQWSMQKTLNVDRQQKKAFRIIASTFVLTYYDDAVASTVDTGFRSDQIRSHFKSEKSKLRALARKHDSTPLRMFLDGPGGAGKSRVITEVLKCAEAYTTKLGVKFDSRTIVVTALSGVAAVSIGGETIHSAASLKGSVPPGDLSWANARLLIIDEVSFMSSSDMAELNDKLKTLCHNRTSLFGGMNIIFAGDFRQLEPCAGFPLYSQHDNDSSWQDSINCYIELQGLFRFKDDLEWGRTLRRIREDRCTSQDIYAINKRVLAKLKTSPPKDSAYCVYMNADRSAIDAGIFANKIKTIDKEKVLVIKASNIMRKPKKGKQQPLSEEDKDYLFQNCGDNRLKTNAGSSSGHFVDPLLKLYQNAPLMMLANEDVPNGKANGTRVLLCSVVLKEGAKMSKLNIDGVDCNSVEANDVKHLLCVKADDPDKYFQIQPKKITCRVSAPVPKIFGANPKATINFTVTLSQVPLVANNATTGHKLQGQTKESLVMSVWSNRRNWNYVALSRVQTRDGLYLVNPLPFDADFSWHPDLRTMIANFQKSSPVDIYFDAGEEQSLWEGRAMAVDITQP